MYEMRHATIDDIERVAALLDRCAAQDGRAALSEFKALRVPVANGLHTLVATDDRDAATVLAVAAWHPTEIGEEGGYWAAEIVVAPGERSAQTYAAAAAALERDLKEPMALWAFDIVQIEAAAKLGLQEVRAIIEMRRTLPAGPDQLPDDMDVRPFIVDQDETNWLVLNQRVFAHHPEAGSIDSVDLALRMAQTWFDPDGLLILCHGSEPIGYAWTKEHAGDVGEIYMIGLIPEYRGRGLARPLTSVALERLATQGATTAMLYAEASNAAAIGLYESMGFSIARRIAMFQRVGSEAAG
ncbi:MAG: mycothiol synthase [bacterium]|nr:mycothiol synthase [bacterium]